MSIIFHDFLGISRDFLMISNDFQLISYDSHDFQMISYDSHDFSYDFLWFLHDFSSVQPLDDSNRNEKDGF